MLQPKEVQGKTTVEVLAMRGMRLESTNVAGRTRWLVVDAMSYHGWGYRIPAKEGAALVKRGVVRETLSACHKVRGGLWTHRQYKLNKRANKK